MVRKNINKIYLKILKSCQQCDSLLPRTYSFHIYKHLFSSFHGKLFSFTHEKQYWICQSLSNSFRIKISLLRHEIRKALLSYTPLFGKNHVWYLYSFVQPQLRRWRTLGDKSWRIFEKRRRSEHFHSLK